MRSTQAGRWLACQGAVFLLLTCSPAPGTARASCGDYVLVGGKHTAAGHTPAAPPRVPAADAEEGPAREAPPCRGPFCSSRHVPPPAPPAPPPEVERWGCLAPVGAAAVSPPAPCPPPAASLTRADRPADIFHPPRSRRTTSR